MRRAGTWPAPTVSRRQITLPLDANLELAADRAVGDVADLEHRGHVARALEVHRHAAVVELAADEQRVADRDLEVTFEVEARRRARAVRLLRGHVTGIEQV